MDRFQTVSFFTVVEHILWGAPVRNGMKDPL